MRPAARSILAATLSALSLLALPALADDTAIKLLGKGPARDALNAAQYKPFDTALWAKTDAWKPAAPSKETTTGKPVLLILWASWYKTSLPLLAEGQRLADKNKDLVVIGLHQAKGFGDRAIEAIESSKATYPIGKDASGEVFAALGRKDAAPLGYYIIDRAGNLRFADVEKSSLDDAVKIVVDESAADAAKAQDRAKESKKAAGDTPMAGPEVKDRVAPEDYKAVKWPPTNKGQLSAKNFQGKPLPAKLGKEKYLAAAPERDGKIIVLDFWATWCPPCRAAMPHLDELYKKHSKDIVVIGISDEDESKVKSFIKQAKHSYPQAIDPNATVKSALGIEGIPHVVVLSTDGVIRWQGNPHPSADLQGLESTVSKLIEVDPGVKARRSREKGEKQG